MKKLDTAPASSPKPHQLRSALRNKLHETNAKLAAIVESCDDAIIGKDLNGIITSWNKGAERIYGYTAEEAIGRSVSMLIPSGLAEEVARILEKLSRGETIKDFETMRVRKDGRQLNISLTISPIKDASGRIVGSSTIGRDITQRIKDQEVIQRQAYLLDQIRESVITTDLGGTITSWNNGAARMFSYAEEEALGKPISLLFPENRRAFFEHDIIVSLKEKGEHEVEVLVKRKSGEAFYALLLLRLLKDGGGAVTGMVGSFVDISARKKTESGLRFAKEEWEQTFDAMPDIVAVIDQQHVIRRVNKALAARLGIGRHELVGSFCYKTICGLEKPLSTCPGSLAIATGKEQVEERFMEPLKGHYLVSCTPLFSSDGSISSAVEVCRDISKRRKLEQKLQEAAITDELTGLLNRRGFLAAAGHQLHVANRENRIMALLYLDLNGMKEINDRFSHKAGDSALRDTAKVLRKTFRESDIIARVGGDEFAALLVEPSTADIEQIVADHLQRNVAALNAQGSGPYQLSLSLGIAYYDPQHRCSLDDLMTKADSLMYRQKQQFKQDRWIEASLAEGRRNRRSHDRIIVDDRWWAEIDGIGKGRIKNISATGVCVATARNVDVGSRHCITIHSPHRDRDLALEVVEVWCSPAEPAREDGARHYESGMSIISSEAKTGLGSLRSGFAA
jgi:diguanylate cyclase (GGDEF)-like protein/PAS domain S-box-containing protein